MQLSRSTVLTIACVAYTALPLCLQASRFWESASFSEYACDLIVDCGGHILSPGFIDAQINGGYGVDFSDPNITEADIQTVCDKLLATGCTSIAMTLVSSAPETYRSVIATYKRLQACLREGHEAAVQAANSSRPRSGSHVLSTNPANTATGGGKKVSVPGLPAPIPLSPLGVPFTPATGGAQQTLPPGARILGLHLEGPFISPKFKGAHDAQRLVEPVAGMRTLSEVYGPLDWAGGDARIVTLAPELEGALGAIAELRALGVVPSMGHSGADIQTADAAVNHGCQWITHLFNAMSAFNHRGPGIVGLLGRMPGGVVVRNKGPTARRAMVAAAVAAATTPRDVAPAVAAAAAAAHVRAGSAPSTPSLGKGGNSAATGTSPADSTLTKDREAMISGLRVDTATGTPRGAVEGTPQPAALPSNSTPAPASSLRRGSDSYGSMALRHVDSGLDRDPDGDAEDHTAGMTLGAGVTALAALRVPYNPGHGSSGSPIRTGQWHSALAAQGFALGATTVSAAAAALQRAEVVTPYTRPPFVRAGDDGGDAGLMLPAALGGDRDPGSGISAAAASASAAAVISRAPSETSAASSTVGTPQVAQGGSDTPQMPSGTPHLQYTVSRMNTHANVGSASGSALELPSPLLVRMSSAPSDSIGTQADRPFYGIIVDGVHVHPYAVTIAYETHPHGLVLVTDAMCAMGLPAGRHKLGELDVDIHHGDGDGHYEGLHAVLAGTDTLAGAVVPLDKCMRNLLAFTSCPLTHALAAVTTSPARLLRLDKVIGTLETGAWADLVLLTENCHVGQTWMAGQLVYRSS